jgi:hypothetical protein
VLARLVFRLSVRQCPVSVDKRYRTGQDEIDQLTEDNADKFQPVDGLASFQIGVNDSVDGRRSARGTRR